MSISIHNGIINLLKISRIIHSVYIQIKMAIFFKRI